MSTPWQYTNASRRVVFYTAEDGGMHSMLAAAPDIVAWVEEGNTIADPPAPISDPVFVPTDVVLSRLTDAEYASIVTAASQQLAQGNGQLARWLDQARVSPRGIGLSDAATITAIAFLTSGSLLTTARAARVFAAQ